MTNSKTAQYLAMVSKTISDAVESGIIHLSTEDEYFTGRTVTVNNKPLVNFSSCSYLGLELDRRLKDAAIDAVLRYGTQFSSSRAYISLGLYDELESLLSQIYQAPVLVGPTTTLGHMSNIPTLIGDHDAVILDHQVHASVNLAVQTLKGRGIKNEMIRHNHIEMLESRIKKLSSQYKKIWYMADGVYSMYGDYAPMDEILALLNKYEQFHLYIDDAHGTGWKGTNGSGYVKSKVANHPRIFITGSMAKSFGAVGGIMVYPDEASKQLVRNCGGTMIFSGPIQPASLAAAVASARIHLSPELSFYQDNLSKRVAFFNETANDLELPIVSPSETPICFIHVGMPEVGYNMVRRLKDRGYFVNLAVYPSVPYKNTGLRLTINNHLKMEDISNVLNEIAVQLPLAIKEENMEDIYASMSPVAA